MNLFKTKYLTISHFRSYWNMYLYQTTFLLLLLLVSFGTLNFYIRLLNNSKELFKVLLNLYKGVSHISSVLRDALDNLETKTTINKLCWIQPKLKLKNTFKHDQCAITMRVDLPCNLSDNKRLMTTKDEPLGMSFPETNNLLLPYDHALNECLIWQ